jgi:hypothetical protein
MITPKNRTVYIVAEKQESGGLGPEHLIVFQRKEDAEQFLADHKGFSYGPTLIIIEADFRGNIIPPYTGIREPAATPKIGGGGGLGSVF